MFPLLIVHALKPRLLFWKMSSDLVSQIQNVLIQDFIFWPVWVHIVSPLQEDSINLSSTYWLCLYIYSSCTMTKVKLTDVTVTIYRNLGANEKWMSHECDNGVDASQKCPNSMTIGNVTYLYKYVKHCTVKWRINKIIFKNGP